MALASMALAVFALTCGPYGPEVVLHIDSDIAAPGKMDHLTLTVTGPTGLTSTATAALSGPDARRLPVSVGLVPDGPDEGPFTVLVSGEHCGVAVIGRTIRTQFVPGTRHDVTLTLLDACLGVHCPDGTTCGELGCQSLDEQPDGGGAIGANLVLNPTFESGVGTWTGYNGDVAQIARDDAPGGMYVAQLTRASTVTSDTLSLDDGHRSAGSVVQGEHYVATAYVRAANDATLGRQVSISLRENFSSGSADTTATTASLTDCFQRLAVSVTVARAGSTLSLFVGEFASRAGDSLYLDEITLRRMP